MIDLERRMGALWELSLQGVLGSSELLIELTSWTYWLSQFAVLGLALLWVYLRRNEHFLRFRDTVLVANLIGLVGYVLLPTAPPRMFPDVGFVDTLALFSAINHSSAAVEFASNPYAAMPIAPRRGRAHRRRHDGVGRALAAREGRSGSPGRRGSGSRVMATANHFWLDIAAGVAVAGVAAFVVTRYRRRVLGMTAFRAAQQTYTARASVGSRARSIGGLARTRVTPNQLTALGVTLCAVGAVLVTFEYRNELLFFWLGAAAFIVGSILDILDGALARAGGKQSAFGAFLDSPIDRVGEGLMLGGDGARVRARRQPGRRRVHGRGDRRLVPRPVRAREGRGARAPGRRRDRLARGARRRHLGRAVLAPWGVLPWAISLLAVTAWITVVQRVLHVRRELRKRDAYIARLR